MNDTDNPLIRKQLYRVWYWHTDDQGARTGTRHVTWIAADNPANAAELVASHIDKGNVEIVCLDLRGNVLVEDPLVCPF